MRGTNVIGARIEKLRKTEKLFKQEGNEHHATIARMCRRELEWVLGMPPQEVRVKG